MCGGGAKEEKVGTWSATNKVSKLSNSPLNMNRGYELL